MGYSGFKEIFMEKETWKFVDRLGGFVREVSVGGGFGAVADRDFGRLVEVVIWPAGEEEWFGVMKKLCENFNGVFGDFRER